MILVDDIGSFPLPKGVSRDEFAEVYPQAQRAFAEGIDLLKDSQLYEKFYKPVAGSLKFKMDSGLDVVNYPQHYDMHRQFLDAIMQHQVEPFLIDNKYAVIPELFVVQEEAKKYFEEKGRLKLKVCVTGAIELYTRTNFGYYVYEEVLENLARSVNSFLRNAILSTKYIETSVVSIDEPSLGFVDLLNVGDDVLIKALEKSVDGIPTKVQIHLHTLKAAEIPLRARGIDAIGSEFAASPKNAELISKKVLDEHDKFLRAGITRTNIDSILAEWLERGISPSPEQLVEEENVIRARYEKLKKKFSERISFVGPDCGLGSWPSQEIAHLLLKRTAAAVKRLPAQ
jgi:5-methyltetrahydropteroyltriglutamate--homocysteine methyltransferase